MMMTTITMTMKPLDAATCWQAVCARDRATDSAFVYAVRTTGIFCLPSCPSRRANRDNVTFFADAAAAQQAGFRPCKRCRPGEPDGADPRLDHVRGHIAQRCREPLPLAELARLADLSPAHLQRRFTAAFGLSPKAWQRACREQALKTELRSGDSTTGAIYAAGYGSGSRIYADANERLGMTPGAYARGGAGLAIGYAVTTTSLGQLLIAATDRGICAVQLGENSDELVRELIAEFPRATVTPMPASSRPELARWITHLEQAIAGKMGHDEIPLDPQGTAFQHRVWAFLRRIPRGETRTYRQVAVGIGAPTSARAVATACASNRIAVLIPCHRVIRGDGGLSGFRWGVPRKRTLLGNEGALGTR
jgi:AraC family transcriptional regulator of adaptative response/methylated-DNA-[protein]-cysteine methyltransferase